MSLSPRYNSREELMEDDAFFDEARLARHFTSDEVDERFLQALEKETAVEEYEKNVEERENIVKDKHRLCVLKSAFLKMNENLLQDKMKEFNKSVAMSKLILNLEKEYNEFDKRRNAFSCLRITFSCLRTNASDRKKQRENIEKSTKLSYRESLVKKELHTTINIRNACYACMALNIASLLYNMAK